MFARRLIPALLFAAAAFTLAAARADGPNDNNPDKVEPVPPRGIELPKADADEIKTGLTELQGLIKKLGENKYLPDVEIYEKAVRYAVTYREVFDAKGGITAVKKVLLEGIARAKSLQDGKSPWASRTGYVVRGYRSKIDGSAQPYGLFVPKDYDFEGKKDHRLDFWWHGRGATLSEVNFMAGQQSAGGIIPAPGAFILYPYGRFCNANKFAGEVDTFECLDDVQRHYRIDLSRLVARGFSMGGAACWQYAVHFPSLWCANAPGAGFSETPEFLKVYQNEKVSVPWYEQKLYRMYNATDYALNIFNLPTVAYSGEIDSQKQAADIMAKSMKKEGLTLEHIIGPKTGHGYEKAAREELNKRIDSLVEKSRKDVANEIKFVTYTLRYNQCDWVEINGLKKHWERAQVDAKRDGKLITATTDNVTAIRLTNLKPEVATIKLDGQTFANADKHFSMSFRKDGGKWVEDKKTSNGLAKEHGLQGPIDDAFMGSFIMVKPSGDMMSPKANDWAEKEMKHAIAHWRQQFRGDAPVKKDGDITNADIRNNNLILWGDPSSNSVLAKLADKLPIQWTDKGVTVGDKTYDLATHVPVLIYPNPLNPKKYVVLNSGFTFREYDYLNNARQVSKLPDYAVLDITTPANSRYPGKVVRAGFFDEKWELLPDDGK